RRSSAFFRRRRGSPPSISSVWDVMSDNALFDLTGKVAAVIGGGSGIGEAVAVGAARQGAQVVVLDANEKGAAAVAARIGGATASAPLDIRDGAAVRGAFE